MRDLFVCSGGVDRSPAALSIADELAKKAGIVDYYSNCFGIHSLDDQSTLNRDEVISYDRIFVMDDLVQASIVRKYSPPKEKIINLGVEDTLSDDRPALIKELREKLSPFFNNPSKTL